MICVSIGRGRHRHMIAEHRHLAENGAQLVELRLDYINGEPNVKRLTAERPCPVVITCRRRRDGGKWSRSEEQRQVLLRTAIAEGVDYVDLEEDVAGLIPRFGKTRRIVSMHDFRKTPPDLEEIHARLCDLDPDIVKMATMANQPSDNLRMLKLVRASRVPTVGICMGDIGIPSRVLTGRFGAPFTYATFHQERALAPGQLSYEQMKEVYRYDRINDQTEVFGVIADPIGHSLSPLIHNAAFGRMEMNRVYLPFRVPRENLSEFIDHASELYIKGLSVTIPHKEAVLEKLTRPDEAVQGIGATNTVLFKDGERYGYNTDSSAALSSIEEAIAGDPEFAAESGLPRATALVLGSGGVGKAIAFGLLQRGAQVVVTDGESERAKDLAKRLNCRSIEWPLRHTAGANLLINGTPIGMHPNVDESPYEEHHLRSSMIVFDAVYNPENTLLVKNARSRGCKVITGVDMFVRQACMQFQLFTGQDGPADLMREVIKRATAAVRM